MWHTNLYIYYTLYGSSEKVSTKKTKNKEVGNEVWVTVSILTDKSRKVKKWTQMKLTSLISSVSTIQYS